MSPAQFISIAVVMIGIILIFKIKETKEI